MRNYETVQCRTKVHISKYARFKALLPTGPFPMQPAVRLRQSRRHRTLHPHPRAQLRPPPPPSFVPSPPPPTPSWTCYRLKKLFTGRSVRGPPAVDLSRVWRRGGRRHVPGSGVVVTPADGGRRGGGGKSAVSRGSNNGGGPNGAYTVTHAARKIGAA